MKIIVCYYSFFAGFDLEHPIPLTNKLLGILMLLLTSPAFAQPDFLGLEPLNTYKLTDGHCGNCGLSAVTSWYFTGEQVAIPRQAHSKKPPMPAWLNNLPVADTVTPVWLGSPDYLTDIQVSASNPLFLMQKDELIPSRLVRQHPRNQAFFNADSQRFFEQRRLNVRGRFNWGLFEIHSFWPTDYRLQADKTEPLPPQKSLQDWVQDAPQEFESERVWQRDTPSTENHQTAIGLMLNGAQGDDHEALAGHFALVTGQLNDDGRFDHWLVNNFYNLDSFNEKSIIAAPTPMDKYLADLNSGQNYYRPSYMLVAVVDDKSIATEVQQSLNQLFRHFYHHHLVYDHAQANCTGLSLDVIKALGFDVATRGNEGILKATAGYFYRLFTQGSFREAQQLYDYMTEERTRLLPAQAFDAIGEHWLALSHKSASGKLTMMEKQFQKALQSLWLVKIPQFPSSRATGNAPVFSIDEYRERAPDNRDDWQTAASIARPFPARFNTAPAVNAPPSIPMPWPVALLFSVLVMGVFWLVLRFCKRFQRR